MRVYVYPADNWACGAFRMSWPSGILRERGHRVTVVPYRQRTGLLDPARFQLWYDDRGQVLHADYPKDAEVMVFQRVCEREVVNFIGYLNRQGITTVVDVDDDLSAIDAWNPAFLALHPRNARNHSRDEPDRDVSFNYLHDACRIASFVTVTTPGLLPRYAPHGRGAVIPNYLPDHYFTVEHPDSATIGWPAAYFSHPNDPQVTRGAIARLVGEGYQFHMPGDPEGAGRAFGLPADPPGTGSIELLAWPTVLATVGVGIVPLADTRFNSQKSWLKGLELSAVGVPWVASPRTEYRRLHQLGCGQLADKPKDWYRRVKRLCDDPAFRADLSQAGRAVAAELKLRQWAHLWWEAWELARQGDLKRGRAGAPVG